MVMLVGVQSNQFPRALDIARPLRAARHSSVAIGGFHVSGRIAMLKSAIRRCAACRGRWACRCSPAKPKVGSTGACATLCTASWLPLYNFMDDLPAIEGVATAAASCRTRSSHRRRDDELRRRTRLPVHLFVLHDHQRSGAQIAPALAGRRRTDRARERRAGADSRSSSPTTTSPATKTGRRSSIGSSILREVEKLKISFIIQVDTLCHRAAELHREGGARRRTSVSSSGWRTSTPRTWSARKEASEQDHRVPQDAAGVEERPAWIDLLRLHSRLPRRYAANRSCTISRSSRRSCRSICWSSSILTPLPGSEDHKRLHEAGVAMDPDLNKYDLNHVVHRARPDVARGVGTASIMTPGKRTTRSST